MIYVDRSSIPVPEFFEHKAEELKRRVLEHYDLDEKARKQTRAKVDMRPLRTGEVKEALFELFSGKCAYCEQPLEMGAAEVDQYRPKSLYPFLAYDWENLYLACRVCNRNKAARFPLVDESTRARSHRDDLSLEEPLLLDPCRDRPVEDLAPEQKSGLMVARPSGDAPRADATIHLCGLNRKDLVQRRKKIGVEMSRFHESFAIAPRVSSAPELLELVGKQTTFTAVRREATVSWLNGSPDLFPLVAWKKRQLEELRAFLRGVGYEGILDAGAARRRRKGEPAASEIVVPPVPASKRHDQVQREVEELPLNNAWIQSIELTRFKCIERLEVRPCAGPEEEVLETEEDDASIPTLKGWTTFLGENGCGKSSILQAVTLALAGEQILRDSELKPSRFLMRGRGWGQVKLELSTGAEIVLRIYKKSFKFLAGAEPHGIFVRAYGPTRLLPLEEKEEELPAKTARVVYRNMFNPFQPLLDADTWLSGLGEEFDAARLAIKDLLGLEDDQNVELVDGKVRVNGQPLENLSAGYQTLVALACDVMAGAPGDLKDMQRADGIVLIDELGSHLHPAWKMRIVARLRKAFPLMQFLVSTHEPLCLRGHSKGEVLLVRRDAVPGQEGLRVVTVDDDLPSPNRLRVDQLLTSQHFGLNSTIDPRIDRLFDEYYQLLARKDELDDGQRQRSKELSVQLQRHGILGYTRRDQLMYEAIDEFLAYEEAHRLVPHGGDGDGDGAADSRRQRWQKVKHRLADLWRFASVVPEERAR